MSRVDYGLLVILVLPFLVLAARAPWIFSGLGQIDPWVYFGFFLDLPAHLKAFSTTYYGSRLSWILPGYVVYRVFAPLVAVHVLHFAFYYAATFSLYLTLKSTVGRRAALLSAILMGGYGYFLWAVGWDYVDGAGITYFLLATLAVTYAAKRRRWWIWLTLAGAWYAAMIYSQLFLIAFTPSVLLYYVLVDRERRRPPLLAFSSFALGFLAITGLLAVINYKLTENFLFFLPSLGFAAEQVRKPNPWRLPLHAWATAAIWLTLPTVGVFGSVGSLFLIRKLKSDSRTHSRILFQLYFLSCALILLAFQVAGKPVLQLFWYSSLLIPTLFLAVGAQLTPVLDRLRSWQFMLLVCGTTTTLLLAYLSPADPRLRHWVVGHALSIPVGIALVGAAIFLIKRTYLTAFTLFVVCLIVALLNLTTGLFQETDPNTQKHEFLSVVQSVWVIQSLNPSGDLLFWYNLPEQIIYRSVASTYLWGYRLINEKFPTLGRGEDSGLLKSDTQVVILSNQKDAFQKADLALSQIGLAAQLIAERSIHNGPISWNMVFIEVRHWPIIEDVQFNVEGWPQSASLRWRSHERQLIAISGQGTHRLFSSDMNATSEWEVNRYGRSGGLGPRPSCFAAGDSCGVYSSGDRRDHLASPFLAVSPTRPTSVFFSIWIKPLKEKVIPRVFLQDERFFVVAESRELSTRNDGWVLCGNWLEVGDPQKLRIMVMQPPGITSLLSKVLLVEFPTPTPSP